MRGLKECKGNVRGNTFNKTSRRDPKMQALVGIRRMEPGKVNEWGDWVFGFLEGKTPRVAA